MMSLASSMDDLDQADAKPAFMQDLHGLSHGYRSVYPSHGHPPPSHMDAFSPIPGSGQGRGGSTYNPYSSLAVMGQHSGAYSSSNNPFALSYSTNSISMPPTLIREGIY